MNQTLHMLRFAMPGMAVVAGLVALMALSLRPTALPTNSSSALSALGQASHTDQQSNRSTTAEPGPLGRARAEASFSIEPQSYVPAAPAAKPEAVASAPISTDTRKATPRQPRVLSGGEVSGSRIPHADQHASIGRSERANQTAEKEPQPMATALLSKPLVSTSHLRLLAALQALRISDLDEVRKLLELAQNAIVFQPGGERDGKPAGSASASAEITDALGDLNRGDPTGTLRHIEAALFMLTAQG